MRSLDKNIKDMSVKLYKKGYSGLEIAKELGISKNTVYREIKKQGVEIRDARTSVNIKKCPKCTNKNGLGKLTTGIFCSICLSEIVKKKGKIEILKPQSN